MTKSLSVVMPVHNEAAHLPATIDALVAAAARSALTVELVLVDDGSTDGSAQAAEAAAGERLPVQVLSREQEGRFKARRAGVSAATSDIVLLLDARVRLHPDSLRFLGDALSADTPVWNGHVVPQIEGNPFGAFGNVLVHIAWAEYFDEPRSVSFGLEDFDHFPKGTGCFVAPRELLLEAMDEFSPRVSDWRLVSDDTQLIRWIAARQRIHLSPEFGCDYQPRSSLRAFVGNALYRGSTFLDGHGRRESRFFPLVAAFFPLSAGLVVLVLRRPVAAPVLAAVTAGVAGAAAARARRPAFETLSFAALAPVYAVAHGTGMWRALAALARERLR
jgi:glycosyltransferase involved in cell wall biosynthesis